MVSKLFLGVVVACIIGSGVIIYITADKIDNNNYGLSAEITGSYVIIAGILWALSIWMYDRYGDGNILLAIIWFRPLFRIMFDTIFLLFLK
jgi:hypothetical protein